MDAVKHDIQSILNKMCYELNTEPPKCEKTKGSSYYSGNKIRYSEELETLPINIVVSTLAHELAHYWFKDKANILTKSGKIRSFFSEVRCDLISVAICNRLGVEYSSYYMKGYEYIVYKKIKLDESYIYKNKEIFYRKTAFNLGYPIASDRLFFINQGSYLLTEEMIKFFCNNYNVDLTDNKACVVLTTINKELQEVSYLFRPR